MRDLPSPEASSLRSRSGCFGGVGSAGRHRDCRRKKLFRRHGRQEAAAVPALQSILVSLLSLFALFAANQWINNTPPRRQLLNFWTGYFATEGTENTEVAI